MRRLAPLLLMLASGFAGLGYQLIWTQQAALWLGHESAAVLAVVAAFFGGLALGGLLLGARIEQSRSPRAWYVASELSMGSWGLVLVAIGPKLSGAVLELTGLEPSALRQWLVAFGGCSLLFLPATAAMGATLPAMERLLATHGSGRSPRSLALLYAANTSGAVLGVLVSTFWLVQSCGLRQSTALCALLNALCGVAALLVFPRSQPAAARPKPRPERGRAALWRLAGTGLLGIGYEVVVVRVLSQVTEETVYTFALLLAVYLVGTALGAAGYQRWLASRSAAWLQDRLLVAQALTVLLGTASLWKAAELREWASAALGGSAMAAVAAEAVLALGAFGLPTLVMGAVFCHLSRRAHAAGVSFGRALGVNTLGACAAPAAFGVLALPLLGPKWTLLLLAGAYLALVTPSHWASRPVVVSAVAIVGLGFGAPALRFVDVPAGGRVVSYREGPVAAVSVVEDAGGVLRLRIDNRQQEGSSSTLRVDARQAWIPLLLHPEPRRALFLGLGTGVTAAAAAADPKLGVDVVELLPDVIAASAHFVDADSRARLRAVAADARRYVRVSRTPYDVVVADNFHPARSGAGSLYTVEHFRAVRERLTPAGVFCQWLPLHQLDLPSLRSIVRSFVSVYPQSWAFLANNGLDTPTIGLLARRDQRRWVASGVRARLEQLALAEQVRSLGLEDEYALLGSAIAGPRALQRFAGDAPANVDDQPIVAYTAPFITYRADTSPRERLMTLLDQLFIAPSELLQPDPDAALERLAAYWSARDRFIRSGRDVRPAARVEDMLAQVRQPLLDVLRLSPDFRPAYDPLFGMASALARSNVSAARQLLAELAELQPARSEAPQLLSALGGAAFRKPESGVRFSEP